RTRIDVEAEHHVERQPQVVTECRADNVSMADKRHRRFLIFVVQSLKEAYRAGLDLQNQLAIRNSRAAANRIERSPSLVFAQVGEFTPGPGAKVDFVELRRDPDLLSKAVRKRARRCETAFLGAGVDGDNGFRRKPPGQP